ncbi:hypothetical protein ACFO0A_06345 [Novosphingobium tardum]|jgi:hypothetical protein|uniref:Uncharacterized protein n=1 Tax=Novosphingobium tardum TaxID=1538021 RepID=A0ABV8RMS2_9SPHN
MTESSGRGRTVVREEIARYRCSGANGLLRIVIEYQLVSIEQTGERSRRRPGVRGVRLESGEELRLIDARSFEVPSSGELISVDDV